MSENQPQFETHDLHYRMARDDGYTWTGWKKCDFLILTDSAQLSSKHKTITFKGENLRWMWEGGFELTLDLNVDGLWQTLEIRMSDKEVQRAANILEDMAQSAGRRLPKRPGRRLEYVRAQPATQDIYGSWSLGEAVSLYLTPLYLVVIQNGYVQREIHLDEIDNITTLERIDNPDEHGLLQFDAGDETLTFATREYETFAAILAQATRTDFERLESQKRKQDDEG